MPHSQMATPTLGDSSLYIYIYIPNLITLKVKQVTPSYKGIIN